MTNKSQITIAVIALVSIIGAAILIFYKSSSRGEVTQSISSTGSSLQSVSSLSSSSSQLSSTVISSSRANTSSSNTNFISKIAVIEQNHPQVEKLQVDLLQPCEPPLDVNSGKCFGFSYMSLAYGDNFIENSDFKFLADNTKDVATYYFNSIKSQINTQDYYVGSFAVKKINDKNYLINFYIQNNSVSEPKKLFKNYQLTKINDKDGEFEEVKNSKFPEDSYLYGNKPIQSSQSNAFTVDLSNLNPNYLVKEPKTKTGCDPKHPHIIVAEFGCYYYSTFFNMYKPAVADGYDVPDFVENNFVIATCDPQKLYRLLDQSTKDYLGRYIDQIYSNHPLVQVYYVGQKSPGVHTISFSIFDSNYLSGPGDVARFYTNYEVIENANDELKWRFDESKSNQ